MESGGIWSRGSPSSQLPSFEKTQGPSAQNLARESSTLDMLHLLVFGLNTLPHSSFFPGQVVNEQMAGPRVAWWQDYRLPPRRPGTSELSQ